MKLKTGIQRYIKAIIAAEGRMGELIADFGKTAADYGKHRAGFPPELNPLRVKSLLTEPRSDPSHHLFLSGGSAQIIDGFVAARLHLDLDESSSLGSLGRGRAMRHML
jgi:hypothetical protein